jgi:alkanesulfonate monooxygenase SsuD/methylene tetrahydromethanopterin reductase-like flavin-dependent oxidoreductase (luciferase family)
VLGILTGDRRPLQPPEHRFLERLSPEEQQGIAGFLGAAVIGGPDTVREGLLQLQQATGADEIILTCDIYEPELRLRSMSIAADCVAMAAA